jgi:hypothetical protein
MKNLRNLVDSQNPNKRHSNKRHSFSCNCMVILDKYVFANSFFRRLGLWLVLGLGVSYGSALGFWLW